VKNNEGPVEEGNHVSLSTIRTQSAVEATSGNDECVDVVASCVMMNVLAICVAYLYFFKTDQIKIRIYQKECSSTTRSQ
jgi:hypothetical protein